MNPSCLSLVIVGLIAGSLSAAGEPDGGKRLTTAETIALLCKVQVHDLMFPEETLEQRAARIREIAAPHGLAVSISSTVNPLMEIERLELPKGDLPTLLKFTCGIRMVNWRPVPGGVEFYYTSYRDASAVEK